MEYMEWEEIEKFDIGEKSVNDPVRALPGYYYQNCPRCKKPLDSENGHFVNKCTNCGQMIDWTSKTPTLEKMVEIQEQSELCGEFLDWFLHKYTVFERKQKRESAFVNADGAGDYINKEKLLAEFFEIDLDEAEREKESLLKNMR